MLSLLTVDTLDAKTLVYWNLSLAYNGRTQKPITAEYAFKRINNVLMCTDSNRAVSKQLMDLKAAMVKGPELEDALSMTANQ